MGRDEGRLGSEGRQLLLAHHLAETLDDRVLRRVVGRVLRRDLEHGRHHTLVLVQEIADLGRTLLCDEDDGNLGVRHKAPERLLDLRRRRLCGGVDKRGWCDGRMSCGMVGRERKTANWCRRQRSWGSCATQPGQSPREASRRTCPRRQ